MSKAKDSVMKLIAKKQKKNAEHKARAAQRIGPNGIVIQFVEAMEKIAKEAKNNIDYDTSLAREARLLNDNLKALDRDVNVEVVWFDSPQEEWDEVKSPDETWKLLHVEGVKIVWSDNYIIKNPEKSKELYIDVGSLFLEGFIN